MPLWLDIYLYIMIFIIGTLFGSFFTLASYRIPRKLDIVKTRSFCPKCNHKLGFFDLIPVFSYIFHIGKCKYCKEKISIRYLMFEILSGVVFVLIYYIFGISIYFIIAIAFYIAMFLNISVYLMKKKYILEKITKIQEEKIVEVDDIKNNKTDNNNITKKKINSKKGVFVSEIVIAMFLFIIVISMVYTTSKNTINKEVKLIIENNAYLVAANNTEIALGTVYEELYSFSDTEEIDGIVYYTTVDIIKYSDMDFSKKDYIKKINTKVEYMIEGKSYEYTLSTLKKKVVK